MKKAKLVIEFLNEERGNSYSHCPTCGRDQNPIEIKTEVCIGCEEEGYWIDSAGATHFGDEEDESAMFNVE